MAGAEVSKSEVVGREEDLATVRGFLADIERLPSAVFVEGEAGIGKTTLWRAGAAAAEELGYLVLSTRPAEAESRISYAALSDLLGSVIDRAVVELPPPQRGALEVALLLRDAEGRVPDQGAIAFGVLGALRAVADMPVLVAVDDAPRIDRHLRNGDRRRQDERPDEGRREPRSRDHL